jgi:hypothetical protein
MNLQQVGDHDLNELSYKMDGILSSLQAMQHRETKYQPAQNYLAQEAEVVYLSNKVEVEYRDILCKWCFRVVDHFRKPRHVVASAVNFVDRFVCGKPTDCDRNTYRLVATTSLYLALKLEEGQRSNGPDTRALLYRDILPHLTNGKITLKHILRMEIVLLRTLGFYVHPTVPTTFAKEYIEMLPSLGDPEMTMHGQSRDYLATKANYFTDMAVLD